MTTVSIADLEYASRSNGFEKDGVSGALAGAIGGAGVGLLTQALRPKDRDQNGFKEYLISALTGAGLGGAAGFAYDNLSSNRFTPEMPKKQPLGKKILPLPQAAVDSVAEHGGPEGCAEYAFNRSKYQGMSLFTDMSPEEREGYRKQLLSDPGVFKEQVKRGDLVKLFADGGVGAVIDESKKNSDGTSPIADDSICILTNDLINKLVPQDRQDVRDRLGKFVGMPVAKSENGLFTCSIFDMFDEKTGITTYVAIPDTVKRKDGSYLREPIFTFTR